MVGSWERSVVWGTGEKCEGGDGGKSRGVQEGFIERQGWVRGGLGGRGASHVLHTAAIHGMSLPGPVCEELSGYP